MTRRGVMYATLRTTMTMVLAGMLGLALVATATAQSLEAAGMPRAEAGAALRPGDVVRLSIYREPELSGDFAVDEEGVVVFPKLGPLQVTAESPASLRARLVGMYAEFLNHSSITVVLLRRVQVLGAVRAPGLYPMDATITVGDALALAGGATPQGNPNRLLLIRDGQRLPVHLSPEMPLSISPVRSGDQIFVPERSWLARNPGIAGAALTAAVTAIVALLR